MYKNKSSYALLGSSFVFFNGTSCVMVLKRKDKYYTFTKVKEKPGNRIWTKLNLKA